MIILTIAIPTYNRESQLKEQMTKLASNMNEEIEVLVSDNASEDGTEEFMLRFVETNKSFRYQRHQVNLGFDQNIKSLYLASSGKFIWFVSDDDPINPEYVSQLLKTLRENMSIAAVCLILGDKQRNRFHKSRLVSYANYGEIVNLEKNKRIDLGDSHLLKTNFGTLISQISTCIVARIENLDLDFNGGGIAHVVITHRILNRNSSVILLDSKAVRLGSKETISKWFMESCFEGIQEAYSNLENECGSRYSHNVIDATKVLGLRIAFWNMFDIKSSINWSMTKRNSRPKSLRLFLKYFYWAILISIGKLFPVIPKYLSAGRIFSMKLKQKCFRLWN